MNNKGNAGYVAIITTIVLFELLVVGFTTAITGESINNLFNDDCDCGVLGCSVYLTTHGIEGLAEQCNATNAELENVEDQVMHQFWSFFIVGAILFVLNLALILIIIFVIRGI